MTRPIYKATGEATHDLIVLFISVLFISVLFICVLVICAYSFSEHESYGRGSPVEEPAGEGSLNCDPRCEK